MDNTPLQYLKPVLASASPRRRELLSQICENVRLAPTMTVDESYPDNLPPSEVAPYVSKKKAAAYKSLLREGETLITADTVVVCDGDVLGKPSNESEAHEMLSKLSGNRHTVVSGVTVIHGNNEETFAVHTDVEFAQLTEDEISYYVQRYRPYDKAGAYGIQEWIGYIGISGISGDYYNVMGLPLQTLYTRLKRILSEESAITT